MTIKEMAVKSGMSADTLRYYERIGVLPKVPRNHSGIRDYPEAYMQWVNLIVQLKEMGMSLEAIADYVRLAKEGTETAPARKEMLLEAMAGLNEKMKNIQHAIQQATYQVNNYDRILLPKTDELILAWPA
jgi:DNA-binding transcriptional MerR regulator